MCLMVRNCLNKDDPTQLLNYFIFFLLTLKDFYFIIWLSRSDNTYEI